MTIRQSMIGDGSIVYQNELDEDGVKIHFVTVFDADANEKDKFESRLEDEADRRYESLVG